jgi:segregation and condensation protein A
MHKLHEQQASLVERQIRLDRFTVKDKIRDIVSRVRSSGRLMFFDLFEADFTKSEMINTFLALLELLKGGHIRARQDSQFSDITITAGEAA